MSGSSSKRISGSSSSSPEKKRKRKPKVFLAVHYGAGRHSKNKEAMYRSLSDLACRKGLKILNNNGRADEAVVEAMVVLENSKKLNAGKGSYLTMNETVEVDAGFMSGNGKFGGIGAAPGIPNPCLAAKALANLEMDVLVSPNLLVGPGAKSWTASMGLKTCGDEVLICKRAKSAYNKFLEDKSAMSAHTESDTIGCIALDADGHVAASGSTGGGLYKFPGRVGPIAQYGCGIYAEDCSENSTTATAVATTGTGEYLTELRFAHTCDKLIREDDTTSSVTALKKAMDLAATGRKPRISSLHAPIVGMIGLTWTDGRGEFVVAHNSDNLVYAYTGSMFRDKVIMRYSEKSENKNYTLTAFNI
ncbi:unnamed protein product [Allacma fusca]|uniref:Asparaginase n=2 Tax=Allacma fusca TaxID=39272 RepID=A0A8J2P2A8_9HEXA|nr:unnamed protein product [Allacma fusca]